MTANECRLLLLCGLSMSLGWRIRGQFGHEIGAAIAGALGAMAIVLLSGRRDWWQRIHFFALFGALGWGFGGSMSYMKVVGYCHSSDSATVLYGFGGLFLIGFLWAALGGAGAALPAVLDNKGLGSLFPSLAAVFSAWFLQDIVVDLLRQSYKLSFSWLDSDWLQATVALAAVVLFIVIRRRVELGDSLVLHLAIGWWAGMGILVVSLGLHMNPPRGDNWAGCVGLFVGLMVFCRRHQLRDLSMAALLTGLIGGVGFVVAQTIKLAFIATGAQWGWHAVMEWNHGLFFGFALAVALLPLIRRAPAREGLPMPHWMEVGAIFFLVWVIPYLNFAKSPARWLRTLKSPQEHPYGIALASHFLPSRGWIGWMEAFFLVLGAVMLWMLIRHRRRPWALAPESAFGKGQILYLVFLGIFVTTSFAHLEGFEGSPISLTIQWLITSHGILLAALLLAWSDPDKLLQPEANGPTYRGRMARAAIVGLLAGALICSACWGIKRALFGDNFAGYFYTNHIRFGPNNTNDKR